MASNESDVSANYVPTPEEIRIAAAEIKRKNLAKMASVKVKKGKPSGAGIRVVKVSVRNYPRDE